ncbi:tyrosinase family oxidase copper chaperone [Nocardiopsis rhodophaea]|uniref:tyrosinase family oxidase copper chaperone n=1 Tax=Nocardiopsis rhodophaea TaxID=280238 RepID=UPI0031DF2609
MAIGVAGLGAAGYLPAKAQRPDASEESRAGRPYRESYRGRTIQIHETEYGPDVRVDGDPLHLMQLGANAYVSSTCHYEVLESPLQAARAAVDELQGARLLDIGNGMNFHRM